VPKTPHNYERTKEKARKRAADESRIGRDIGDIPPVVDHARKARTLRDFRAFCDSYFQRKFTLPWSEDHLRVIGKIETATLHGGLYAMAMPRAAGKSTICEVAAIWALVAGHHSFVYLIGNSEDHAITLLEDIQSELANNDGLAEDYPEAIYPIRRLEGQARRCVGQLHHGCSTHIGWGAGHIIMPTIPGSRASGAIVRVTGITGNIRGAIHTRPSGDSVRPSLVIVDDPQTDQSARSPSQSAQREAILAGAILGLAGPGRKISAVMPCTVIVRGDMADSILDRDKHPEWQGERTKMVYAWPTDETLWTTYARLRSESQRADGNGSEATEFYRQNRAAMDAGSRVAWEARHNPDELSGIQHAYNLRLRSEKAFAAEYQNEPLLDVESSDVQLTAEKIFEKATGRPAEEIPLTCTRPTMFIDVHDRLLYYAVAAWQEDFGLGHIIEYGVYPRQPRGNFTLRNAPRTLEIAHPGMGSDGAILAGIEHLVRTYLAKEYRRGENVATIDRLLVDMGYKPALVAAAKRSTGGPTMLLSKGIPIPATKNPMSTWRRKPGERWGHHWYMPNVARTAEYPHLAADVNYWKTALLTGLSTARGQPGSIELYGRPADHDLLAAHLTAEVWTDVQANGRTVRQWQERPDRRDNHWWDCLVGCMVAASNLGCKPPGAGGGPSRGKTRGERRSLAGMSGAR